MSRLTSLFFLCGVISYACQDEPETESKYAVVSDAEAQRKKYLIDFVNEASLNVAYGFSDNKDCANEEAGTVEGEEASEGMFAGKHGELQQSITEAINAWLQPLSTDEGDWKAVSVPSSFNFAIGDVKAHMLLGIPFNDVDGNSISKNWKWPHLNIIFECDSPSKTTRSSVVSVKKSHRIIELHTLGHAGISDSKEALTSAAKFKKVHLVRALGLAFGLKDKPADENQYPSVMNTPSLALASDGSLSVTTDDANGIRFLYKYLVLGMGEGKCSEGEILTVSGECVQEVSLIDAIMAGDLEGVKQALAKEGANVNEQDKNGDTPLHWAVRSDAGERAKDSSGILEFLTTHAEIDIDKANGVGNTPLHYAVHYFTYLPEEAIIQNLIRFGGKLTPLTGSDITLENGRGDTALYLCENYHVTSIISGTFPSKDGESELAKQSRLSTEIKEQVNECNNYLKSNAKDNTLANKCYDLKYWRSFCQYVFNKIAGQPSQ